MPHRIYLDHAATTPLDPRVLEAMLPYLQTRFGNPSSVHKFGQEAHVGLNTTREIAAGALGCQPDEIIFTSCATESNNTILKGYAHNHKTKGNHIITSAVEHPCVLETCAQLECEGFDITYVQPDKDGIIELETVRNALRDNTILVSIMAANNEIGTVQPIAQIGAMLHEQGIFFHTDAVQYYGHFPCKVAELQVDALTLSAHKFFGPKGVGLLYVKKGTNFAPLLQGGGQEFGLRAGTQNVPGIVGMGKAMQLVEERRAEDRAQVQKLRDVLLSEILKRLPDTQVNGSLEQRLPSNLNLSFPGVKGEILMIRLDLAGIAVSTGSACSIFDHTASHVLSAIGLSEEQANNSLRLSLGKDNTEEEMAYVGEKLEEAVRALRKKA